MSEQSYTHKSLAEIRYIMATRLGLDPSGDASDMVHQHLTECIRAASLRANENVQWLHARTEYELETQINQNEIAYPAGCGPGSIIQLSIWIDDSLDALPAGSTYVLPEKRDYWQPLQRRVMLNGYDSDPIWQEGGDDLDKIVGPPLWYDVRDRILIRPMTDQAYKMKLLYTNCPELKCDNDNTVMDAELIILYALVEYNSSEEFQTQAQRFEQRAAQRLRSLRAQQTSGTPFNAMRGVDLSISTDVEAARMGGLRPYEISHAPVPITYNSWGTA